MLNAVEIAQEGFWGCSEQGRVRLAAASHARSGRWSTLRITWRDHPRRPWIEKVEDVGPNRIDTETRLVQLPCNYGW